MYKSVVLYLQEYFVVHQLILCWFVVALYYVTVTHNVAQYSTTSDNELEKALSPHPPLKPGAYFKPVIF